MPSIQLSLLLALITGLGLESGRPPDVVVVESVAPVYPLIAVYSSTSGAVMLKVQIASNGAVTSAQSIEGPPLLHAAAEDAAKRWRFRALGTPAEARLVFKFTIMPKDTTDEDLSTRFLPPYELEVRRVVPNVRINRDPGPS